MVINVPATSANMGPGFDSFGVALNVFNELRVERLPEGRGLEVRVRGEGAGSLPEDSSNMVAASALEGFLAAGGTPGPCGGLPDVRLTCVNNIPPARGLGSSSAALVSGLGAGLVLAGENLSDPGTKHRLLQMATATEGHPDNVAPAIYGGMQVAIEGGGQWISQRIACPAAVQAVLFIPDFQSLTAETRAELPTTVPIADAVHNISRAAMLVNCFATGRLEALRYACEDRLHQPIRGKIFPLELRDMIDTALAHGAHGCWISGAGPTILALTGGHGGDVDGDSVATFEAVAVSEAMQRLAREAGLEGRVLISEPTPDGVRSVDGMGRVLDIPRSIGPQNSPVFENAGLQPGLGSDGYA